VSLSCQPSPPPTALTVDGAYSSCSRPSSAGAAPASSPPEISEPGESRAHAKLIRPDLSAGAMTGYAKSALADLVYARPERNQRIG
jgi:hypothetical protein